MTEREDGKEVLQEVHFRSTGKTPPKPGYIENPDQPGQWVTPQYVDWLRDTLGAAVQNQTTATELDPEIKQLATELAVLHLPAQEVAGRKAEPTRVEIHQSTRMADYLHKRGWRFHPEFEQIRHTPTPNGQTGDLGIHITRNADGTWPTPNPEDFYDPEKIVTSQARDGSWVASHPSGVYAQAATKARAHANCVQQLLDKTEDVTDE